MENIKAFVRKLKSELKYGLYRIKNPELKLAIQAIEKLARKELIHG